MDAKPVGEKLMAGPYGITQFDAAGVINNYQAMQQNRIQSLLLQKQTEKLERDAQTSAGIQAALSRYTGGKDESAAASSPSRPSGGAGGAALPEAPAASSAAPSAPRRPTAADRERLFSELMALDPQAAGQVFDAITKMDESQAKAASVKNELLGNAAQHLLGLAPDQRAAELQRIAPILIEQAGIDPEKLRSFDPTNDTQLKFLVGQARDIEKIIESSQPKLRNVGVGDVVIDEKTGSTVYESPVVQGPGGEIFSRPGAMSTKPPTATGPNGEKIQLNPQSGQWEPVEGGQGSGSGGFPGN